MAKRPAVIPAYDLVLHSDVVDPRSNRSIQRITPAVTATHVLRGIYEGDGHDQYFYVDFVCTPSASLAYDGFQNLHDASSMEPAGPTWDGTFEMRPKRRLRDASPRLNPISLTGTPMPRQRAEIDVSITLTGRASNGSSSKVSLPNDSSHTGTGNIELRLDP